ncbi:MAG: leucine-rich repeat domain-containing protein, partial [Spirochaetaceae bacterium]|nr:leucine-rich repeat domain-containing protein [Spirochaetaceae bacterium]
GIAITGYSGKQKQLVIPALIRGFPVTVIDDRAFKDKGLLSVEIPSTVRKIGRESFTGNKLQNVDAPKELAEIEPNSFDSNLLVNVPELSAKLPKSQRRAPRQTASAEAPAAGKSAGPFAGGAQTADASPSGKAAAKPAGRATAGFMPADRSLPPGTEPVDICINNDDWAGFEEPEEITVTNLELADTEAVPESVRYRKIDGRWQVVAAGSIAELEGDGTSRAPPRAPSAAPPPPARERAMPYPQFEDAAAAYPPAALPPAVRREGAVQYPAAPPPEAAYNAPPEAAPYTAVPYPTAPYPTMPNPAEPYTPPPPQARTQAPPPAARPSRQAAAPTQAAQPAQSAREQSRAIGEWVIRSSSGALASLEGYAGHKKILVLPFSVEGKRINAVAPGAFAKKSLQSVTFSSGISVIGDCAFSSNRIGDILIPPAVRVIGAGAFEDNPVSRVKISAGVSLQPDSFPANFAAFYNEGGRRAGTYSLTGSGWVYVAFDKLAYDSM